MDPFEPLRGRAHRMILYGITVLVTLAIRSVPTVAQDSFADKIYPRGEEWSVKCTVYRLTEKTVYVLFPGRETPSEIHRTAIGKIEYEGGTQLIFNEYGQIVKEITLPQKAVVAKVLSVGLFRLDSGEEIVLNGVDISIPADSAGLHWFDTGREYLRSMVEGQAITIQFDLVRRDRFGRHLAYIVQNNGVLMNAILIKNGYSVFDRSRPLLYRDEFEALEEEARANECGVWSINKQP